MLKVHSTLLDRALRWAVQLDVDVLKRWREDDGLESDESS
jgi:hypothetical protein